MNPFFPTELIISIFYAQHTTQEQTVQGTNILLLQETIEELRKTKESFNNAAEVMRELNSTISRRENLVDAKFTAALEAFNRVGKQLTALVMNFGEKKPAGRKGKHLHIYVVALKMLFC
jgi:hypothetical protein